jgi:glycosyltransferase involved in cell wall biosynthesis
VIDLNKIGLSYETALLRRVYEIGHIVVRALLRSRKTGCIYMNLSQSFAGNLRDLLIFAVCFPKLQRTAVHLHGGPGLREVLSPTNPIRRRLNAFFYRRIGAVIVLADRFKSIFDGVSRQDRVRVVPNFAPESLRLDEATIVAKFSHAAPLRLLFLTNLLPGKGHAELVEAYRSLAQDVQEAVRLDFAGDFEADADKAAFLSSISDLPSVTYHGVATGEAKSKLFREAHIFCLPTYYRYEGQPISILEAYASGCVVMTTDHSGIPDIFEAGRNGFLVAKQSSNDIRDAIGAALSNPADLLRIALNNREDVERYPTAKYNRQLRTIIEQLVFNSDLRIGIGHPQENTRLSIEPSRARTNQADY